MESKSRAALEQKLSETIRPVVEGLGLELVEVVLRGGGVRVVRLDIDRAGPIGVGIEDCQRVSRAVEPLLDGSDFFPSKYVLEVSSPGADRPIHSLDDIRRNTGRRVVVTTREPVDGSCFHRGLLVGAEDDKLLLEEAGARRVRIPLQGIVRAVQDLQL